MSYFKLYLKYLSIHIKTLMQYKVSFLLTVIGQLFTSLSTLVSIWFMFTRFNSVQGFTLNEILICFAVMLFSFSLAECFARGFDGFAKIIGNGDFDRIMVRPRNEIFQILAQRVELSRIGRFIQALCVMVYVFAASDIAWTASRILTLVLMVLCGTVLFSALFLVYASFCFFTLDGLEFMNIFTDGGRHFGRYPFSVYGVKVLKFFTYIVPLALVQYYPFLYVIGRTNDPLYTFVPLAATLFCIPAYIFWRFGVRHFKSTGS